MNNKTLQIIMRLKDEASKKVQNLQGRMRRFANAFKQNWLMATAAITAAIMAIRKAWDLAEMGAKADQIEQSFKSVSKAMGLNAAELKSSLMSAAAETVNFSNVANKASALMAQGLSMSEVTNLMRQARAEAQIFGTTVEEAFTNISSAVTGGLVTTLRRAYGLQLSLKEATDSYAESTGLSTDEIKKNYMAQAIANHILEQGKTHLEAVNEELLTNYEQMQKLSAIWLSFKESMGQGFLKVFAVVTGFINQLRSSFALLMQGIAISLSKLIGAVSAYYAIFEKLPFVGKQVKGVNAELRKQADIFKTIADASGDVSQDYADEAYEIYKLAFGSAVEQSESAAEIISAQMKQLSEDVVDEVKVVDKSFTKLEKTAVEKFIDISEMAKQTARNLQSAFSDIFFNVLTGEVSNAKELFADFGRSVIRMLADIAAQMAVMGLLKNITGVFAGFTAPDPAGGTYPGGYKGMAFHNGGFVRPIVAHGGLSPDEVPAILQTGEGVLNRRAMANMGSDELRARNAGAPGGSGVSVTINQYISAWDARDVWRNRKALSGAIAQELNSNAALRGVMRNT